MSSPTFNTTSPNRNSTWRRWGRGLAFRVLSIAMSLLPLLALELLLRAFDLGQPAHGDERLLEAAAAKPLFVLQDDGQTCVTNPERLEYFARQTFAAKKPKGTFRIFFLGGSTVQGNPYSVETAFSTWLRLSLEAADSSRAWETVNCGGISYSSFRLLPIFKEVLQYEPDLIVLCSGHNEFLEDTAFRHLRSDSPLAALHTALLHWRTYNLLRAAAFSLSGQDQSPAVVAALPSEVDTLLDHRGGLEWYTRDDRWRQEVIARYERNIRQMLALGKQSGVPVIVVNPVANVRDCPPFKTEPSADLNEASLRKFESLWELAKAKAASDPVAAGNLLRQALSIDDRRADAWYLLGRCLDELERYDEARNAYLRAKEEDVCPLRILESMHVVLKQAAQDAKAPWIDARQLFEGRSRNGLIGDDTLIDHVHPHVTGHQWIAEALFDEMTRLGMATASPGMAERRTALYRTQLGSLNAAYYERGRQRLEGLRLWTQGRARKAGALPLQPQRDANPTRERGMMRN